LLLVLISDIAPLFFNEDGILELALDRLRELTALDVSMSACSVVSEGLRDFVYLAHEEQFALRIADQAPTFKNLDSHMYSSSEWIGLSEWAVELITCSPTPRISQKLTGRSHGC